MALQKINQEEFNELILNCSKWNEVKPRGSINLKKLLAEHGFMPVLENIDLAIFQVTIKHADGAGAKVTHGYERLKNIDYSDMTFNHCEFTGCNLSESIINNCQFIECDLTDTVMASCDIQNTTFESCQLKDVLLMRSEIKGTTSFENCELANVDFYKTVFGNGVAINHSTLESCVFIESKDNGISSSETKLIDCILPKTLSFMNYATKEQSDPPKPVVGVLWQPHQPGHAAAKIYKLLKKNGAIPVKISYLSDNDIDLGTKNTGLDGEVKKVLQEFDVDLANNKTDEKSRAMYIINRGLEASHENQNISKIIQRATTYGEFLDSILIPGGADIPSDLYGQKPDPRAQPEKNYMRSVLEFALIQDQKKRGNPMMGVCRGCQIMNVYHGGDMLQRVDDEGNFKSIRSIKSKSGTKGIIPSLMNKSMWGVSFHHQAIDAVGDNLSQGGQLEVVVEYNGIVKAVQEKHGAPILMTQFHPEFYGEHFVSSFKSDRSNFVGKLSSALTSVSFDVHLSKTNHEFIPALIKAAKIRKQQKVGFVNEVTALGKDTQDSSKEGVNEESTIKPSSLKKESQVKLANSNLPGRVKSLISNYRYHRGKRNKKIASKFPFFKKTALAIISFLDRNIFSRKEEKVISYLMKETKSIQVIEKQKTNLDVNKVQVHENKCRKLISDLYKAKPNSMLSNLAFDSLSPDVKTEVELASVDNNYENYNTTNKIKEFIDQHPESPLAKAINLFMSSSDNKVGFSHTVERNGQAVIENVRRLPTNEREMLAIIHWCNHQHSETAKSLITPKDQNYIRTNLNSLQSIDDKNLSIDQIHQKYVMTISQLLQGGDGYQRYNQHLKNYLLFHDNQYPSTRQQWRELQGLLSKSSINDLLMIQFSAEISKMFIDKEESQQELDRLANKSTNEQLSPNEISNQQALTEKVSVIQGQMLSQLLIGPNYEMTLSLKYYLERNKGIFPVDKDAWNKFKLNLRTITDPHERALIVQVDKLHKDWQNALKDKFDNFMTKHPYDFFAKALKAYAEVNDKLPLSQNNWNEFLINYSKLSEELLFDSHASDLMNQIHQRDLIVEREKRLMGREAVKPSIVRNLEEVKQKRVNALIAHFASEKNQGIAKHNDVKHDSKSSLKFHNDR